MSHTTTFTKALICLFLLSFTECKKSEDIDPGMDTLDKCRVSKIEYSSTAGGSYETTLEVDGQQRLSKTTRTDFDKDGSQTSTETTTYTYDADGFLIRQTTDQTNAMASAFNLVKDVSDYSYTNGRLQKIEQSATYEDASRNNIHTHEYEYDGSGDLSKYTSTSSNGEAISYSFVSGKLTGVTGTSRTLEINGQGLITKATSSTGSYVVYAYDSNNRQTSYTNYYSDGTKSLEFKREYATTLFKIPTNPVAFKGHPQVPFGYGEQAPLAKTETLTYSAAGEPNKVAESTYTYEVDSRGNLVSSTQLGTFGSTSNTNTHKYSYDGCM